MAVDHRSWVQLDDRCARAHEACAADGSVHCQGITVHTDHLITLTCTPSQQVRTTGGWVRADQTRGTTVLLAGYHDRVGTAVERNRVRDHLVLTDEHVRELVHDQLLEPEKVAGPDLALRVRDARAVATALLGVNVPVRRTRDAARREVLIIHQPHAARYQRIIGCLNAQTGAFADSGESLERRVVPIETQRDVVAWIARLGLDDLKSHQAALREAQELSSLALTGDLRVLEALRLAEVLRTLPVNDVLLRTMLVNRLMAQQRATYPALVTRVEPCSRTTFVRLARSGPVDGVWCRGDVDE